MIAFAKNSDIQKWFEAKNMSNSTQNIKEWAGDPMYPRDSTQNDWEKHKVWAKTIANMVYGFNGSDKNNPPMKGLGNATLTLEDCLADARREGHELGRAELVEFEVEKARREERANIIDLIQDEHNFTWVGVEGMCLIKDIVATLRKEESHG